MAYRISLIVLSVVMLVGCASVGSDRLETAYAAKGKVLHASGFSHFSDDANSNRRWLMAQQAAKLNAYRDLSDLLYREALGGGKTVGSQVMKDEVYRVYADTYLRNARPVDYRTVKDSLKSTLELALTPNFYRCMAGDVDVVKQCLEDDRKLPFTRLGYQSATLVSVNAACANRDCSDQLYVQGFSNEQNPLDDALLNAGLYDTEWAVNTGIHVFGRYFLFKGFINGL